MQTATSIKKQAITIKNRIVDVEASYYASMSKRLDALNKKREFATKEEYEEAKIVISNFIYLIHERLKLKFARKVNYKLIRRWAAENYELASFLLNRQFPEFDLEGFEKWAQTEIPVTSMAMYDRSTAETKDSFH